MATQEQLMQKITELEKEIKQLKETINSLTSNNVIRHSTLIRPSNVISPVSVVSRGNVISPVNVIRTSNVLVSPTYRHTSLFGYRRRPVFSLKL